MTHSPCNPMTSLVITQAHSRREQNDFVALPRRIYCGLTGFEPSLDMVQRGIIDRKANPFFHHGDAEYWLARRGDQIVGRISAQLDQLDAQQDRPTTGHFGNLAAADDAEAVAALLQTAEDWLRARGVVEVTGPFNLSINGESGLLVAGHEERNMFLIPWDPPYLPRLLEQAGYVKARDLFSYHHDNLDQPIRQVRRVRDIFDAQSISMRYADLKQLNTELDAVCEVFNDAWRNNWGFVPFQIDELRHMAKELRPFLHKQCLSMVEVDGKLAAFALGLPNLQEMFHGLDGRLFPFGWMRLLKRWLQFRFISGRILLMGVHSKYQKTAMGAGLALLAIDNMRAGAAGFGMRSAELGWVLDDNEPMLKMLDRLGARHSKTHRVYRTALCDADRPHSS
ncbi:MAG: dATP pyrophosphohydrolase [Rhizobiaceae bacterium]